MNQQENETLSHLNLPNPKQTQATYYLENGVTIDRDDVDNMVDEPQVCAKKVTHLQTNTITYFVLCTNAGQMFDTRETDSRYRMRNIWKFRRVTRTAFNMYVKFLQHKYTSMLSQAQRSI